MRTFKSIAASVLTAAATLGFVALSAPAQACGGCNNLKLNGPSFHGLALQGAQHKVKTSSGAPAARCLAVTLPSGKTVSLR